MFNTRILLTFTLFASFLHCIEHIEQDQNIVQQKHQSHAFAWAESLISQSQPQEIQIAANILYLLYANALIDIKIRQFVIPIARLNQSIRSNIIHYKDTSKELAILKTLLDRLTFVIGARTIYNQKLKTCLDYYNARQTPITSQLMVELQSYGQNSLNEITESNSLALATYFNASAQICTAAIKPLQDIASLYTSAADGSLSESLKNDESTKEFAAIIALDEIVRNTAIATENIEHVLNALDATTDASLQIISSATDIYRWHYEMVYNHISSDNFDKTYAQTLFGMNDMLPNEYKSALPHPDNAFEHVLQTIKLYTKIELTK